VSLVCRSAVLAGHLGGSDGLRDGPGERSNISLSVVDNPVARSTSRLCASHVISEYSPDVYCEARLTY
jgi:hypothetical protein